MLDYFLLQGYVEMNEDGSIVETALCPKDLVFNEDENNGRINFFRLHYQTIEWIKSIEQWEANNPRIHHIKITKDSGTQVNQS